MGYVSTCALICLVLFMDAFLSLIFIYRVFFSMGGSTYYCSHLECLTKTLNPSTSLILFKKIFFFSLKEKGRGEERGWGGGVHKGLGSFNHIGLFEHDNNKLCTRSLSGYQYLVNITYTL
jgi:hypothetical protein